MGWLALLLYEACLDMTWIYMLQDVEMLTF